MQHELRLCAEEAGFEADEEDDDLIEGSGERPGDVTVYISTHIVAIDVTVVHIQAPSFCPSAARSPGRPVEAEEKKKRTPRSMATVCGLGCGLRLSRWMILATSGMQAWLCWSS